jgi:hypothetical protein
VKAGPEDFEELFNLYVRANVEPDISPSEARVRQEEFAKWLEQIWNTFEPPPFPITYHEFRRLVIDQILDVCAKKTRVIVGRSFETKGAPTTMEPETSPEPEYLSLADLSPELQTDALHTLACPVIPIIPDAQQLGSGVLVEVDGVSGILTAEHVVFDERFQKAQLLYTIPHIYSADSVNEKTTHFSGTKIRMDLLRCFPETPRSENDEWGPDLAFIRLPKGTAFERSLRAVRINFYPLAHEPQTRLKRALDENYSLLAIVGAPVEMSEDVSPSPVDKRGIIEFPVFLAPTFKYQRKENGHDFFNVPVDRELGVRIPNFFNGVSGGAVWRLVNLFKQDPSMHELKSSDYVLAGIAFWQGFENQFYSRPRPAIALRKVFAGVARLVKWAKLRARCAVKNSHEYHEPKVTPRDNDKAQSQSSGRSGIRSGLFSVANGVCLSNLSSGSSRD